jgi:hypothetical protein
MYRVEVILVTFWALSDFEEPEDCVAKVDSIR